MLIIKDKAQKCCSFNCCWRLCVVRLCCHRQQSLTTQSLQQRKLRRKVCQFSPHPHLPSHLPCGETPLVSLECCSNPSPPWHPLRQWHSALERPSPSRAGLYRLRSSSRWLSVP